MKTTVIENITKENGKAVAHLDTNYNVAKMVVTLGDGKPGEVVSGVIHFAQNKITSDLIWFANAGGRVNSSLEFVPNCAATVSDIYITLSNPDVDVTKLKYTLQRMRI